MMRSMFSGVSGLRAHQTRMDVIGNNIANVNTVGFKSGRVTFQEIFSQTLRGASAPDSDIGRGGTNPMQVGLGLGINSVDTLMTRGSVQRTDNLTDLAIEGEGFFIVKGSNNTEPQFTRAGNFMVDQLGNLVTANGLMVQGWMDYDLDSKVFNTESDMVGINLYNGGPIANKKIIPPKATDKAIFSGNLNSSAKSVADFNDDTAATTDDIPVGTSFDSLTKSQALGHKDRLEKDSPGSTFSTTMKIYDELGNPYNVNLHFIKMGAGTSASGDPVTEWKCIVDPGADLKVSNPATTDPLAATDVYYFDIEFDTNGKHYSNGLPVDTTDSLQKLKFFPNTINNAADAYKAEIDLTGLSNYALDFSAKPTDVNGYPSANLVTFSIGSDGIITGIYSNGEQMPLGQIALGAFENPAGLEKVGQNLFRETTNSGAYRKTKPAPGVGTLSPGTLEMSNVDLSKEFTEMIVTQRGFQANSRIITTSDEMLQELVNLKR